MMKSTERLMTAPSRLRLAMVLHSPLRPCQEVVPVSSPEVARLRVLTAANMVSMLMFGSSQSPGLRSAPRHQEKISSSSAAP